MSQSNISILFYLLFDSNEKVNYCGSKNKVYDLFHILVLKLKVEWVAFTDESRSDEIYYLALMSQPNISI